MSEIECGFGGGLSGRSSLALTPIPPVLRPSQRDHPAVYGPPGHLRHTDQRGTRCRPLSSLGVRLGVDYASACRASSPGFATPGFGSGCRLELRPSKPCTEVDSPTLRRGKLSYCWARCRCVQRADCLSKDPSGKRDLGASQHPF